MTGEEFRAVYDQMCAHLGRLPTVRELAFETDLTDGAVHWHLRYRGLPFKQRTRGGNRRTAKAVRCDEEELEQGSSPRKRKAPSMRVYYIDPPKPPERGALILPRMGEGNPGEGYDARQATAIRCYKCSRAVVIFPRVHLWWLPVDEEHAAAVCSDACAGRMTRRRLT
ncbi:MAG: hypothetical protein IKK34_14060 [Clostridia bacterium]|nr:hypothetical protein [Clostridia bacterium]